jgi:DHA1 family 2-module integral membrane pump EmrD-like MFS transporter
MRPEDRPADADALRDGAGLLVQVVLISLLGSIGSSLYVPTLPALSGEFGVTAAQAQATISHYLFGLALAQLVFGPLSDRWGRRVVLAFGFCAFLAGTAWCGLACDWWMFVLGRCAQGVGASITSNAARTVLRDRLSGSALSKAAGYNGIALAIGLSVAPLIGAVLQGWVGWRGGFAFMAAYVIVVAWAARARLPETNHAPIASLSLREVAAHYQTVARHRGFWANVLCAGLANAGLSIFYGLSPYVLQQQLGLTPLQYSLQMIAVTVALIAGRLLNAPLIDRLAWHGCLQLGNQLMVLAGLLLLTYTAWPSAVALTGPVALFTVGAGFVFSNSVVGAMQPFPGCAGTAGALYGFVQMSLSAGLNLAFIRLAPQHPTAMGACFAVLALAGYLFFGLSMRTEQRVATA